MAKEGLYKKLAEVLAEIERIPKNGRNEHFKYDYVMEADLVDHIRPILAEKKLVILPSVEEVSKENNLSTVKMRFRFIDAETGDYEENVFVGQGQDSGDKGYYKAYTGAVKYCLMKTFLVATGDDPEIDEDELPRRKETGASINMQVKSKEKAKDGTVSNGANTSRPASSVNFGRFWASVKNLGLSEEAVHKEAAAYFNAPGLQSLNDVPGLDTGRLNKFLAHLISLKSA